MLTRAPVHAAALRRTRGTMAGLVCGVGAVLAHVAAGAAAPSLATTVGVVVAAVLVCVALAGDRLEPALLLGVTLATQGLLHMTMTADAAGHAGDAVYVTVGHTAHLHGDPAMMLLSHLAAGVLTAVLASGSEAAWRGVLWALIGTGHRLLQVLRPVPIALHASVPVVDDGRITPSLRVLVVPSLRGPPGRRVAPAFTLVRA